MSDNNFGFGGAAAVIDNIAVDDTYVSDDGFVFDEQVQGGGKFLPRIAPGSAVSRYECREVKDLGQRNGNVNGKTVYEITFTAHVQRTSLGDGRLLRDNGGSEFAITFQRVSTFKSEPMRAKGIPSDAERLYSALGLKDELGAPKSLTDLVARLQGASGRQFAHSVIWTCAHKVDGKTVLYSTSPNTKRNELAFPRNADGSLVTEITFADGVAKVAREEVRNYRAVKATA